MRKNLAIYIHYPFCKSKCPYCDFNSHISNSINHEAFEIAYLRELEYFKEKIKNKNITSIFFGGGTPSLMPLQLVEKILDKISEIWNISKSCEITLEANPTSFETQKFESFKRIGINRISLGIQSLNDADLKFLGRNHSSNEAIDAIKETSRIFENFSFDLIYARPNQSLESWREELLCALKFESPHLSLYQLTIEKGTQFFNDYRNKIFTLPSEETSALLYELTAEICEKNNLYLYEISNYSKPEFESQHNLNYWKSGDYLGVGAGAHSRVYFDDEENKKSIIMLSKPDIWLKENEKNGCGIQSLENISDENLFEEIILSGLRLKDGINLEIFEKTFKKPLKSLVNFEKLQYLSENGLIEISKNSIKITKKGRLLTNKIIEKII